MVIYKTNMKKREFKPIDEMIGFSVLTCRKIKVFSPEDVFDLTLNPVSRSD